MTWELDTCANQRPSTKKPVKHISIGFAPDDGLLSSETIEEIANAVINGLGYDNNQYLVVRHDRVDPNHDRTHEHDHFHILVNAINFDGQRVTDGFDKTRLEKILRQQEIKHNLAVIPSSNQHQYKASSTGQIQRMMREIDEYQSGKRTKKPTAPYMIKIQSGIDLASHDRPRLTIFLARLQQLGIDCKFRIEENNVEGISYRMQDFKVKGCKLHKASLPKLLDHRLTLDTEQDQIAISLVNAGEKLELAQELEVKWNQTNIRDYVPSKIKSILDKTFGENNLENELERVEQNKNHQGFEIDF